MENKWYILLNFYPIEKQIKLIQLLLNKASNIYVRKDYFQYIEWKEEWKKEYINELYEDFVSNSLYLDSREETKINEEIIQALKYQEFFNPYMEDIHALKQKLKNNSLKNTERIKTIIKTILRKYMDSIEYVEEEFF